MKITLDINDSMLANVKALAAQQKTSLILKDLLPEWRVCVHPASVDVHRY